MNSVTPYKLRIGDLELSNYYREGDSNPKPFSQSSSVYPFSLLQIVKYVPNEYYEKESEFRWDGDYAVVSGIHRIHKSCFQNKESKYVLALWPARLIDHPMSSFKFVGSRPFELTEQERNTFWRLGFIGERFLDSFDKSLSN